MRVNKKNHDAIFDAFKKAGQFPSYEKRLTKLEEYLEDSGFRLIPFEKDVEQ